MRVHSGPPKDSASQWIVLGAMLVALVGLVGVIFKLQQDGARFAEPFVRDEPAQILVDSRLFAALDPALHAAAEMEGLETERKYLPAEQLQAAWQSGKAELLVWLRAESEGAEAGASAPESEIGIVEHQEWGRLRLVCRSRVKLSKGPLAALQARLASAQTRPLLEDAGWRMLED